MLRRNELKKQRSDRQRSRARGQNHGPECPGCQLQKPDWPDEHGYELQGKTFCSRDCAETALADSVRFD